MPMYPVEDGVSQPRLADPSEDVILACECGVSVCDDLRACISSADVRLSSKIVICCYVKGDAKNGSILGMSLPRRR